MSNHVKSNLKLLDWETLRLKQSCRRLNTEDLYRPTLCAEWDVAQVLTHLCRNADALSHLVKWAVDGVPRKGYVSDEQRDADIVLGAQRPLEDITRDVIDSADRFRQQAEDLRGRSGDADVQTRTGNTVKAHQIVAMRIIEVVFHHCDLNVGFTLDHADPGWLARTVKRGAAQWEAAGQAPPLTLRPQGMNQLELAGGGPEVAGTKGQLLLWLARGRTEGLGHSQHLPTPPPWA